MSLHIHKYSDISIDVCAHNEIGEAQVIINWSEGVGQCRQNEVASINKVLFSSSLLS